MSFACIYTAAVELVEMEESDRKLSPIMHRTSAFFDRFDSISTFSESTIADSEFVARQIKKHENEWNAESSLNKQSTIYNLRIDNFVIDGGKTIGIHCQREDLMPNS